MTKHYETLVLYFENKLENRYPAANIYDESREYWIKIIMDGSNREADD